MSANETLKKLKTELQNSNDSSIPQAAKDKLLPLLEKYPDVSKAESVSLVPLQNEIQNIIEEFKLEHPTLIDFVNVISGMGI